MRQRIFCKHADTDPDATLEFNPSQSEVLIVDACYQYRALTGESLPLFQVYEGWFMVNNPGLFNFTEPQKKMLDIAR